MNFTDVLAAIVMLGVVLSFGISIPSDTYENYYDSKDGIVITNAFEEFRDIVKEKNLQVVSNDGILSEKLNELWETNRFNEKVSQNVTLEGVFIFEEDGVTKKFIKVVFVGERISQEYFIVL